MTLITPETWTYNWVCWIEAEIMNNSPRHYSSGDVEVFQYKGKDNAGKNFFDQCPSFIWWDSKARDTENI